jgi:hypothetical protein
MRSLTPGMLARNTGMQQMPPNPEDLMPEDPMLNLQDLMRQMIAQHSDQTEPHGLRSLLGGI